MSQSSGAIYTADKLFPTPLLKCPLAIFNAFCKEYNLHPGLVSMLHHARRRKKNRMFQRITRICRGARLHRQAPSESDDEGKCTTIDSKRVYNELIAAVCNAAVRPVVSGNP